MMEGMEDGEGLMAVTADVGAPEVVQVIMQEDGQIVMPEGQFIQVNTADGQTQYIQVTGEGGENQLIQLMPDGQAQLIQVSEGHEGAQVIHVSPENLILTGDTDELTNVNMGDNGQHLEMDTTEGMPTELVSSDEIHFQVTDSSVKIQDETLETVSGGGQQVPEDPLVQQTQMFEVATAETTEDANDGEVTADIPIVSEGEPGTVEADELSTTVVMHSTEGTETPAVTDQTDGIAAGTDGTAADPGGEPKQQPVKSLDMNCPIALTSETVVVVDGKKCVLRVDPDSNHLVAYPFKPAPIPGKRGRGRPRKVKPTILGKSPSDPNMDTSEDSPSKEESDPASATEKEDPASPQKTTELSEQENSAAEGLLGLSEDGVRRSHRKRKKATFLTDYETGALEGIEDTEVKEEDNEGSPVLKRGRGRPPSTNKATVVANSAMQTLLMNMGVIPMKRGRGRPRRNPLPQSNIPIPAFIIPSTGGQAVMMAPVHSLGQLETVQKVLNPIRPRPPELAPAAVLSQNSIMVETSDGIHTQVIPAVSTDPGNPPKQKETEPDSGSLDDDTHDPDYVPEVDGKAEQEEEEEEEEDAATTKSTKTTQGAGPAPTTAFIQLPQNLVSLLLPKKEPVKIGLKATESDLEKMKCPKCDFQAYYPQQYQEHIAAHTEDISKCKCCNFLTFEKDGLLEHFRDAHPKCICSVCDFTAEHAYVIKRHMMRHGAEGCECELCGKRYKDQYILKMHIKMVHMPAEVLFECQICCKKFTRKAHLKRHLRIHDPEKPYKCSHCDYRGCERSDITKHLLIHEEPRHICEVCGKAFRHIKNKELHVKRHKGQRDYKCGVCDFYGYTFTDIRKHIERKHSDAKNILCDKCGSAFKTDMLLKEHQKRQCELLMIEQALAGGNAGGTHTIQIPNTQLADGRQILVDGNQVNITVEQVALPDDVSLTDEQIHEMSSAGGHQVLEHVEMAQLVTHDGHVHMAHHDDGVTMDATHVAIDTSQVTGLEGAHVVTLEETQVEMETSEPVVVETGGLEQEGYVVEHVEEMDPQQDIMA